MMIGTAATVGYLDYRVTRDHAADVVAKAVRHIALDPSGADDFDRILGANEELGKALIANQPIVQAYNSRDRGATQEALKAFLGKTSFSGIVTLLDDKQTVFFSTDAPNSTVHNDDKDNLSLKQVYFGRRQTYKGAASLTATQSLTLSAIVPIKNSKGVIGALAVSTPMDSEFLAGLVERLAISPGDGNVSGIDIVMLNGRGEVVSNTNGVMENGFYKQLQERGLAVIPGQTWLPEWAPGSVTTRGFENSDRWWKALQMTASDDPASKEIVAVMLVSTPVPNQLNRLKLVIIIPACFGLIGLLIALLYSGGISRSIKDPLRFLIRRTEQISGQRTALPPLEGLDGDWLVLGEQIDTAVTAMRSTVQSLKTQLARQQHDTHESSRQADDVGSQLDQMNRQFSLQSKQINELSKQLNTASRQAIVLQHKLDSVLQVSTEGYLILDQFGNVLSANPVFLNWLGATEGEIAGRLCFDLVKRPGEPRDSAHDGQAFARHGGDPHALINQFYPDGVVYHRHQQRAVEVMAHLQPVISEDSNIQGYIMVLRDKSLRTEIAQLRAEIVAMLSESIRGPLTAAEGVWSSVLNNAAQTMHPSVGQPLAELHGHYEQIVGVVDSLLMMYGGFVPPATIPKEQVVITRLVAECLEEVANLARNYQLALDYRSSPLPTVAMSKEAVRNTLVNVLQRMIGLTQAGGRVRVETMLRGQELRIGVMSSGPALSEVEIGDLFAGFIEGRHDESTYSDRLSMYLARNTVERFGGKIWAESEAGRGTVVYFTVPVQIIG